MVRQIYLNPDKPLEQLVLNKTDFRKAHFGLHTHNYCEFSLVVAGRGIHLVNGSAQILQQGDLCFVRANDEHTYRCEGDLPFEIYNQGIPAGALSELAAFYRVDLQPLQNCALPPRVRLDARSFLHLSELLKAYMDLPFGERRAYLFRLITAEVLYALLYSDAGRNDMPAWFSALLYQMEKPENHVAGLPRLLELSGYSQAYVNRCFQKYLRQSPTCYINRLRLCRAMEYLCETQKSALEVALLCGFSNYSYFFRQFSRFFGFSPSQVRNHTAESDRLENQSN